jgi:hypothetical protein
MAQSLPKIAATLTTDDARQGETSGHVRYVLAISLTLALIAGVILLVIFPS